MAEDAADDLDGLVRRVDPDRWLTTRFVADPAARADVVALYAFDHELARARRAASTPLLAEIRLTWWREVLEQIFADDPVRRHPAAEALAGSVRRHALPRALLEAMIDGQVEALESPALDAAAALAWADAVEGSVARLASAVLDPAADRDAAALAGRAWGLALLLRGGLAPREAVEAPLRDALGALRRHKPSVAGLPALLPARLARFDLAGRAVGPARRQLSLIAATATGRV